MPTLESSASPALAEILATQKALERSLVSEYLDSSPLFTLSERGSRVLRPLLSGWKWIFPPPPGITEFSPPAEQRDAADFLVTRELSASPVEQEAFLARFHRALMTGAYREAQFYSQKLNTPTSIAAVQNILKTFRVGARDFHILFGVFFVQSALALSLCEVEYRDHITQLKKRLSPGPMIV